MKKIIIPVSLVFSILLAVAGCKINGIDLKELIETDVKTHNNPTHYLNIETTSGGTVSPGNRVEIVDEVPIEITATAEDGYAFKHWLFTTGENFAALEASERTSGNFITISGSDVSMQAVFVRQPVVISYYPQDDDVARNMPVRIVFSKIMDDDSITSNTIQVFDNLLNRQIEGELEVNGSEVIFYAKDSSLEQTSEGLFLWESNRHYQVYIRQNVLDTDGITLLEELSWFFSTGTEIDNNPPVINSFTIEAFDGDTSYTNDQNVLLSFDADDESMIPIRAVKYWNLGDSEPATVTLLADVVDENGKIPFQLSSIDGVKQVNLKVYDLANNYDETSTSITLDETVPVLTSSGLIDPDESPHDADGFANTRNLTFQLIGTDSNMVESLGWVIDGSVGEMTWQNYEINEVPITLPDNDGEHTVTFAVRDIAGNVSATGQKSIILDRTAPTGTVIIKGGAAWAGTGDQNATLSLTRSDLSAGSIGEITIAIQVDGDGWSSGNLSSTRAYVAEITDVDLYPNAHSPSLEEEVTVSIKLIDAFDHERIITDTIKLDFTAPIVSSFTIRSLDTYSNNSTTECKPAYPSQPYVRLEISKSDAGGSELASYRYDTDESGINWTSWLSDTAASTNKTLNFTDKYGTKTVSLQVSDAAGNVSTTYTDNIENRYRAYFKHDRVYLTDVSEFSGLNGEIYWIFHLYTPTSGWYNYMFYLPQASYISMGDGDIIYDTHFSPKSGNKYVYTYFSNSPPAFFQIQGKIYEFDSASDVDESNNMLWQSNPGVNLEGTHISAISGDPTGNIRFYVYDNY